jgi:hypothetical protein
VGTKDELLGMMLKDLDAGVSGHVLIDDLLDTIERSKNTYGSGIKKTVKDSKT